MVVAVRQVALPFAGRLTVAFVEIVLAASMLVGSVILGHELKEWRDWFWDPGTTHIWAPTPKPSPAVPLEVTSP